MMFELLPMSPYVLLPMSPVYTKGRVGVGMGAERHAIQAFPHPHPNLPLEGVGIHEGQGGSIFAKFPPQQAAGLVLCVDPYFTGAIKCWYGVLGNIT